MVLLSFIVFIISFFKKDTEAAVMKKINIYTIIYGLWLNVVDFYW